MSVKPNRLEEVWTAQDFTVFEYNRLSDKFRAPASTRFDWLLGAVSSPVQGASGRFATRRARFRRGHHQGLLASVGCPHAILSPQVVHACQSVFAEALPHVSADEWWLAIEEGPATLHLTGYVSWHRADQVALGTERREYEKGKRYFQRHRQELERKFPGEYVAIWKDHVISHSDSFGQVAETAYSQVGCHDMYMPQVGKARKILQLRSPRLRRKEEGTMRSADG